MKVAYLSPEQTDRLQRLAVFYGHKEQEAKEAETLRADAMRDIQQAIRNYAAAAGLDPKLTVVSDDLKVLIVTEDFSYQWSSK